jgi:hypothetical protein
LEAAQVDAGHLEAGAGKRPKQVVSHAADERHLGAEPGRRDSLVRSLPSWHALELGVSHRLARPRQTFAETDEVEIDRADDRDSRGQALRSERAQIVERAVHQVLA